MDLRRFLSNSTQITLSADILLMGKITMNFKTNSGLTVDVSLNRIDDLPEAEHFYVEANNFYTLKNKYKYESIDLIMSQNLIFQTKYHRILLKEWMNFCKVGGMIIIRFSEKNRKNVVFLLSEIFALFGNDIEVDWTKDKKKIEIVITKKKPMLDSSDSIDKWTFGIVTRGTKDHWVDNSIRSIEALGIPKYEIIVCGKYDGKYKNKVKCIYFTEKDNLGWITKKKNLIMEAATYDNAVIVHDRIFFDKTWFDGMKRYGNYFDVLSCPRPEIGTNMQGGDWVAIRPDNGWVGYLDYSDWDENVHIDGGLYIIKKSVWKKVPWNEYLHWNLGEDTELSRRYHKFGVVPRFNPYARCYATEWRHGHLPSFEIDSQKLGRLKLTPLEHTRRFLSPLKPAVMKINSAVPGFSSILGVAGKSRLMFTSTQNLDNIVNEKEVYSNDDKSFLSEIEVSQLDKIQNVLYFTAKEHEKQRKRYKAVEVNEKTEIYLDQVQ